MTGNQSYEVFATKTRDQGGCGVPGQPNTCSLNAFGGGGWETFCSMAHLGKVTSCCTLSQLLYHYMKVLQYVLLVIQPLRISV